MTDTKFTPAPWVIYKSRHDYGQTIYIKDSNESNSNVIASMRYKDEENANLIASAPEMYAELEDVLHYLDCLLTGDKDKQKICLLGLIREIDELLKKARGK